MLIFFIESYFILHSSVVALVQHTQVSEPFTQAPKSANPCKVPNTNAIPEANPEDEDFEEEATDDSEQTAQCRRTIKYKSLHPEEFIIGSKDSPLKTGSVFRYESMIGLISS